MNKLLDASWCQSGKLLHSELANLPLERDLLFQRRTSSSVLPLTALATDVYQSLVHRTELPQHCEFHFTWYDYRLTSVHPSRMHGGAYWDAFYVDTPGKLPESPGDIMESTHLRKAPPTARRTPEALTLQLSIASKLPVGQCATDKIITLLRDINNLKGNTSSLCSELTYLNDVYNVCAHHDRMPGNLLHRKQRLETLIGSLRVSDFHMLPRSSIFGL
ncbi:hypothetical protein EV401DRAFT_2032865 [Pisolithus croceorrhizus]|nr:hypothetical protein EV401DRAFT_2032865 [Pisolithus croceorrhizus]